MEIEETGQLSGMVDTFNCIAEAVLPVYRYGEWVEEVTRHPAWAVCDVYLGRANTRGRLKESRVAVEDFVLWAEEEPDATFDHVFDYRTTPDQAVDTICSANRARRSRRRDGRISVVRDRRQDSYAQILSPAQLLGLSPTPQPPTHPPRPRRSPIATRIWASRSARSPSIGQASMPTRRRSSDRITATGVSRSAQAVELGTYHLLAMQSRPDVVELETDLEHLACEEGSKVGLQSDVVFYGLASGRLKDRIEAAGDVTHVRLDQSVVMAAGKTYAISVRHADLTVTTYSLQTTSGEVQDLALAIPIPKASAPQGRRHDELRRDRAARCATCW